MNQDVDERLGRVLRADAPPERDALFRLRVIERRERVRYRHRTLTLVAAAALTTLLGVASFTAVASPFAAGALALLGVAVVTAGVLSVRGVLQVIGLARGGA
jgi:hypothetical protein